MRVLCVLHVCMCLQHFPFVTVCASITMCAETSQHVMLAGLCVQTQSLQVVTTRLQGACDHLAVGA